MNFLNLLLFLSTLLITTHAKLKNSTREFKLRTKVKPNQPDYKDAFNDLWVVAYHTGAAENDAVLYKNDTFAATGFLNGTNGKYNDITCKSNSSLTTNWLNRTFYSPCL